LNTKWFNFNITLKGRKLKSTQLAHYASRFIPNLKATVTYDKVYNEAKTWNARRLLEEFTPIIIVAKGAKLSGHLKKYLLEHYQNTIIMYETDKNEYIKEFKDIHRHYSGLDNDDEFFLQCCYDQMISRSTKKDFESDKDFIAYRDAVKAEAKANKVPANTGKIILTICNKSGYCYSNKKEFSDYQSAVKYIKELKGGTLYRGLDQLGISETAHRLGYNVISANKRVMEWLSKENFTSRITEDTIYKHKNLVIMKSMLEAKLPDSLPKVFINSLCPKLKNLAEEAIKVVDTVWHYGISIILKDVTADAYLVNQYKEIMNCYNIYTQLTTLVDSETNSGTSISDFLFYIIMKQKKYQINYACYKKIKEIKILSLICKK
jgi:hypothetical protein